MMQAGREAEEKDTQEGGNEGEEEVEGEEP